MVRRDEADPASSMVAAADPIWSVTPGEALMRLGSSSAGLRTVEAARRLGEVGRNELREERDHSVLDAIVAQLKSPLLLLLLFAAGLSLLTGEWVDAAIVSTIVVVSVGVGASRERRAAVILSSLLARIRLRASVIRDGEKGTVPVEELVPGDVVTLAAGSLVPADVRILEASDCWLSEAILTGESFPVAKAAASVPAATPLARRACMAYLGTNVRSGIVRAVVVATGPRTELGTIAERLARRAPETEFDRSLRRFGLLLTIAMLVMVLCVFAVHMIGGRSPVETLLFAIALAVGLSPELLPAILSVNLARGAEAMARRGVLVRHLSAIENLGSMDVLCTDKTGTLTLGVVEIEGAYGPDGTASQAVLELAARNAALETGIESPLDAAILAARTPDLAGAKKVGEIPFDFVRKRVSVGLRCDDGRIECLTKGAFHHVLDACTTVVGRGVLDDGARAELEARYQAWGTRGIRVLAVARRELGAGHGSLGRDDEAGLAFEGFITFHDRPKPDAREAIADLRRLGVVVKMITGDAAPVARHVAETVGLGSATVLSGRELAALSDDALPRVVERTDVFAEVDPSQKERIVLGLKKAGHVVGFMGDGVNDAPAMHAADTSLSVEEAVDVAKAAADFVLLERDLSVIRAGIEEGRRTFANTMKYVLTTMSANLGNMVSMAASSLFLPFLPLLAGQILLNNFLSDIPAVGLASDGVDPELVDRPQRWDMRFIARFMVQFGAVSALFDFLTFALLLVVFHASPALFRTGWFVESLVTELAIALVVRTRRPFFRSRPGTALLGSSLVLLVLAFAIPMLPYADVLGFVPLPAPVAAALGGIAAVYVVATELLKLWFYRARGGSAAARPQPR